MYKSQCYDSLHATMLLPVCNLINILKHRKILRFSYLDLRHVESIVQRSGICMYGTHNADNT